MNYRSFGSTGLQVSEIGLGCSGIGGSVLYKDDRESSRVLHRAFELGINFYDTADSYRYGNSERLIGQAFKNRRSRVVIASKVVHLPSSVGQFGKILVPSAVLETVRHYILPWKDAVRGVPKRRQDFSSIHIKRAIEQSL